MELIRLVQKAVLLGVKDCKRALELSKCCKLYVRWAKCACMLGDELQAQQALELAAEIDGTDRAPLIQLRVV